MIRDSPIRMGKKDLSMFFPEQEKEKMGRVKFQQEEEDGVEGEVLAGREGRRKY